MNLHMEKPVTVVKTSFHKTVHKFVSVANGHVVGVSREYAHLVYFGAVFFEGHGVYSAMGGVLLLLGTLAVLVGEHVD